MAERKVEDKIYKQSEALDKVCNLQKIFDDAAKSQGVYYTSLSADAATAGTISTGVLCMDLLLGGGHLPGRFTYFYGPTGSCKSTMLFHTIREATKKDIKVAFVDSEASTDPVYLAKLGIDLDRIKGSRNKQGWVDKPILLHHYPHNVDSAFEWMHEVLSAMDDKIMMEDPKLGMRYFLIEKEYKYSNSWRSITDGLKAKKIIEVEEATPQLFILVDSLRMVPKITAEDVKNKQPAQLAKALHRGFSMIKSLLGQKMVNLVATNHLTTNPLDKYNKESQPGGEAVKFYPDNKIRLEVNRFKSRIVTENHVSGDGYDRYSTGRAYIEKNKGGTSHREMEYRIWLDEQGEPGRGICPVYDAYQYLTCTNQLELVDEKRGTFKITLDGYQTDPLTYSEFKIWMLTREESKSLKIDCQAQFKTGVAQDLYYEYNKSYNNEEVKKKKAKEKANVLGVAAIAQEKSEEEPEADLELAEDEIEL